LQNKLQKCYKSSLELLLLALIRSGRWCTKHDNERLLEASRQNESTSELEGS